jgi:hypothetical protein
LFASEIVKRRNGGHGAKGAHRYGRTRSWVRQRCDFRSRTCVRARRRIARPRCDVSQRTCAGGEKEMGNGT